MASDQEGRDDTMFEYEVLTFSAGWKGHDYKKVKQELNDLGRQGWRVVGNHDATIAGTVPSEIVVLMERPLSTR